MPTLQEWRTAVARVQPAAAAFGFGHASVGNPGHNALSTLSSHSQNTSHKGETHDGRSFSSHSHSTQSLAQHHTDHSNKADQVVQVDDRGPGKEKGFVDSLPPGQEQQADRGMTLNPDTIHSDLDDIVTLGLPPGQELQPDRGLTLNLETINSDLDDIVTRELPPGLELNPDRGALNPETIHSDPDDIVTGGLPPGLELNLDRGGALNPETIHSDLDDIVTGGLPPGLELNLDRGKSLQVSWQAKVAPGTHRAKTRMTLLRQQFRVIGRLATVAPCCVQPILSWTTMTTSGSSFLISVRAAFSFRGSCKIGLGA